MRLDRRAPRPRRVGLALLTALAGLAGGAAAAAAAPMTIPGTVLFDGGVDAVDNDADPLLTLDPAWRPMGWNGASGSPAVVIDRTSDSLAAIRFDVDGRSDDGYGDRSEVQGSTGEKEGHERAYRWSVYIPEGFPERDDVQTWQVFGQWHSALDGSPPLAFYVNNWKPADPNVPQYIGLDFNLAGKATRCTGSRRISQYGHRVWQQPLVGGQWLEIKMHIRWSAKDASANHSLWVNGVRQAFSSGALELKLRNTDGPCGHYYKQGYYRGHTDGAPVTVWYDNFLMTSTPFSSGSTTTAAFTVSSDSPTAGSRVTLRDASAGRVQRREWDLDGDGRFDDGVSGPEGDAVQTVVYDQPGPRLVRLRVTDATGARVETHRRVVVRSAATTPGRPPGAAVSDSAGGAPLAGAMVTFVANGSDPDGVVTGWEWDLDGDGFDDGEGPAAHATYTEPGPVTVRVRVTDDRGGRAIDEHAVVVLPGR